MWLCLRLNVSTGIDDGNKNNNNNEDDDDDEMKFSRYRFARLAFHLYTFELNAPFSSFSLNGSYLKLLKKEKKKH